MQVPLEKTTKFWHTITFKLIIIGALILAMLIPWALILSLIREREQAQQGVITEIGTIWGGGQTITGPVLSVPYIHVVKTDENSYREIRYAHFLPSDLDIRAEVIPEIRKRGMYRTVVYNARIRAAGSFAFPDAGSVKLDGESMMLRDAFLQLGIPDMRGIQEQVTIRWNGSPLQFEPGIPSQDICISGLHAGIPLESKGEIDFSFDLSLNGSEYLYFIPSGRETRVRMESSWSNPKFDGAFLPDERSVDEDGFTAGWKVLHLNRNYPQAWKSAQYSMDGSGFGATLIIPVDQYRKTERSAKYAIMFIALTFMIFFFVEVLNRKRIHPVQYLLVGLSISIFYVLLLSLAEQIGFNLAYLVSSAAIIALITGYTAGIFRNLRLTLIMGICLVLLYVFLFILIQLQDFALLLGSVGLFAAMAIIMYASRNVDWYSPLSGNKDHQIGF